MKDYSLVKDTFAKYAAYIEDTEMSKIFHIQGRDVFIMIFITDEYTFSRINKDINGLRVY